MYFSLRPCHRGAARFVVRRRVAILVVQVPGCDSVECTAWVVEWLAVLSGLGRRVICCPSPGRTVSCGWSWSGLLSSGQSGRTCARMVLFVSPAWVLVWPGGALSGRWR